MILLTFWCCDQKPQAQNNGSVIRHVGGPCEGCEALLEYSGELSSTDTVKGYGELLPELIVSGTVYASDGRSPAPNVVLYFYQTNREGIYASSSDASGWATRHGQHRAWVKTDASGQYTIYTFRPASYPNRDEPEHIHVTVKEESTIPYYIDAIEFEDDPLLTKDKRSRHKNRGGSGICEVELRDNVQYIQRDIILGKNIPEY